MKKLILVFVAGLFMQTPVFAGHQFMQENTQYRVLAAMALNIGAQRIEIENRKKLIESEEKTLNILKNTTQRKNELILQKGLRLQLAKYNEKPLSANDNVDKVNKATQELIKKQLELSKNGTAISHEAAAIAEEYSDSYPGYDKYVNEMKGVKFGHFYKWSDQQRDNIRNTFESFDINAKAMDNNHRLDGELERMAKRPKGRASLRQFQNQLNLINIEMNKRLMAAVHQQIRMQASFVAAKDDAMAHNRAQWVRVLEYKKEE